MPDWRERRICEVAHALRASNGADSGGASTGELIAGALLAGRPDWAGYTSSNGDTDVIAMIDRLGPEWLGLVRELREMGCDGSQ